MKQPIVNKIFEESNDVEMRIYAKSGQKFDVLAKHKFEINTDGTAIIKDNFGTLFIDCDSIEAIRI